jgi:hypothetical protein
MELALAWGRPGPRPGVLLEMDSLNRPICRIGPGRSRAVFKENCFPAPQPDKEIIVPPDTTSGWRVRQWSAFLSHAACRGPWDG